MLQKNVLEYLEGSAARFPDKLAFTDEGESFTFGRMLACAQGLGTALANLSPRHNGPVAVLVDHTAANLTSFMGVLQSGNFYVPVDSQMPLSRMEAILETLDPVALVYTQATRDTAQAMSKFCPILEDKEGFAHPADPALLARRRAMVLDIDPVYAIFTSGSTGTPKGILGCRIEIHRDDIRIFPCESCLFIYPDRHTACFTENTKSIFVCICKTFLSFRYQGFFCLFAKLICAC